MPLVPFADLLADARRGRYAVGYFESWSLESLLAVADAAEAQCAPVVLGFSGVYCRIRGAKLGIRLPSTRRWPYPSAARSACRLR
jgi:fructose/tagatose bisphosphate aldolase